MRTDVELLEILLEAIKYLIPSTPCGNIGRCIFQLRYDHIISSDEKRQLHTLIEKNKPFSTKKALWWNRGELQPRIKFLKMLIKKYETK